MEIVIVKGREAGDRPRTFIIRNGHAARVAVHVVHDLPHLVVESLFEIGGGLWGELAAGKYEAANQSTTARDAQRRKGGRIVSGSPGARADEWLTDEHRLAKRATNSVMNRSHDGPDTPAGVRARLSDEGGPADALLLNLPDETIELALRGVHYLYRRWAETPPGETLRLSWPLNASFFIGDPGGTSGV